MTKLYLDVLDEPRQKLWERLYTLSKYGAVLAGGTAIAMQIRHRLSEDFDLFLKGSIPAASRREAYKIMGTMSHPGIDDGHQLTLLSLAGLKLTLVSHPYPPLHKLVKTDSLSIFSLPDLASNKAYTIGRRGTWRDYVDLYFLLKEKIISLEQVIFEAQIRFKPEFDAKLFLQQLVYVEDLGKMDISFLRDRVSSEQIVKFMLEEARRYTKTRLV